MFHKFFAALWAGTVQIYQNFNTTEKIVFFVIVFLLLFLTAGTVNAMVACGWSVDQPVVCEHFTIRNP